MKSKVLLIGPAFGKIHGLLDYMIYEDSFQGNSLSVSVSPINLLVGANNSGKSRFMRALMNANDYLFVKNEGYLEGIRIFFDRLILLSNEIGNRDSIEFAMQNIHYKQFSPNDFLGAEHEWFFKINFTQNVEFNKDYLRRIINDFQVALGGTGQEFINLLPQLEVYTNSLRLIGKINSLPYTEESFPSGGPSTLRYTRNGIYHDKDYLFDNIIQAIPDLSNCIDTIKEPKKIYIPILRTARALLPNLEIDEPLSLKQQRELINLFTNTISKSYKINPDIIEIHTGLDLYKKINRNRNDSRDKRILFDEFERFISLNFFKGKDFEIVARYAEPGQDEHLHVSINNDEHEIHFLGDGIQALIILLYPIFLAEKGSWVFIEEPEVHLHPGMQRLFVDTIMNNDIIKSKDLTIFLTTHSNHLFDIAVADKKASNVLAFQKIKESPSKFLITPTSVGELDILNLLEVSNSSVFMANCSIWVEGPTDRIYIRKYLDEYVNNHYIDLELHEDLEYCFFEYAGSNLSHYLFNDDNSSLTQDEERKINAWFLANRIFLIADKDKDKEGKHKLLAGQQNVRFIYYTLPVREIENLLSPKVIEEQLPAIIGNWGKEKRKQWIAETQKTPLIFNDYKEEYLGHFLVVKYDSIKFPKTFKDASGTLSSHYKVNLAKQAAKTITWATMTKEAQELAERLCNYIISHNPILIRES